MRASAKRLWLPILGALLALVIVVLVTAPLVLRAWMERVFGLGTDPRTLETRWLGEVREGRFRLLAPRASLEGGTRFTRIPMQAAQSPESGELDLGALEGRVVLVRGRASGGWVYSAEVLQVLGAPVSFLITRLL